MTVLLHPVWPVGLVVAAAVVLAGTLAWGCRLLHLRNAPPRWVARLAFLRAVAVILFLLALLRPQVKYTRAEADRPDLLVMLDASASMAQPAAPGLSRSEYGNKLLRDPAFRAACLERYDTAAFVFGRTAEPAPEGWPESMGAPTGSDTRLAESLAAAWSLYRQRAAAGGQGSAGTPPRILLVSDGIDRGRGGAAEWARGLGIPVDVLAWPPEPLSTGATAVAVASLQTPGRVLLGSQSRLFATLRRRGTGACPVRVVLEQEGKPAGSADLTFEPNDQERQAAVSFLPDTPGIRRYTVRVEAAGNVPIRAEPPREIAIRVESDRNEVLMLEPTWRWEFKFLRRVFEDDPHFSFSAFLSRGPGVVMQVGEPERRAALGGYPQSRAELSAFDTFILGNVAPAVWPQSLPEALHRLVVEEGKSLIVIAGPDIGRLAQNPYLAALLPVELGLQSGQPVAGPLAVRVGLEGAASPAFYNPSGQSWAARWPDLPPMDRLYPPLRKKPAATVWLEAADRANEYGPIIVAAEHTVGRGRVLFIGTDTLWKWQMLPAPDADGQTPYSVFWQQALRALQPPRLAGGAAGLWVRPEHTRYTQGDAVRMTAEISSARPLENPVVEGSVTLPDGATLPVGFVADGAERNRFTVSFEAALAGPCQLRATLTDGGRLLAEGLCAWEVEARPGESASEPVPRAALESLAAATGGRVIGPSDPVTWPSPPAAAPAPVQRDHILDFWNGYMLLAAFTAVMGLDWLIRLMRGLVS